ncbi:MAG TPA: MmgE/PrpD family protein [Rhizomicrobium sp.]|jgi:2-methylcitrate dehydratase PrpD|nr:MmgE/PrpD family protein [Rhizomicrobium sp.]
MSATVTEQLGAFVAETNLANIPPAVIGRAKVSLLHDFTMTLAGRRVETIGHIIARRLWSAPPQATMLWDGSKIALEGAVFANAALMHARSQDDTHPGSTSHPGAATIPAALAVAEARGRTGAEFLTACILGYEIIGRVGRPVAGVVTPRGYRPAMLFGGFGAAAAAAKLLGLDGRTIADALGFAAHLAGGLGQVWHEGSPEWPLQLGFAARNGVTAALAAELGAGAAHQILEGPMGFYKALTGSTDAARSITDRLGEDWQIAEATIKPYPVCAILQGPVGIMIALAQEHRLTPDGIEEIRLELNPFEANYPGTDNAGPYDTHTATSMSGQFCMALALLDRHVAIDGMLRFDNPTVTRLARRVRIVPDETIAIRSCRLKIRTTDGRMISSEVGAPVGRPTFDEQAALVRALQPELAVGTDTVEQFIAIIAALESQANVAPLLSCLVPSHNGGATLSSK